MNRATITVLALATTLGCAASHPAVEEDPATTSDTLVGTIAAEPTAAATTTTVCTPFATRDCKMNWVDDYGTHHCTQAGQVCHADGEGWTACGDPDAGAY